MYHQFAHLSAGLTRFNCVHHLEEHEMSFKSKATASNGHAPINENQWPPYPPPDETEFERAVRVEEEREAKRVSDAIDREIESDRQVYRRRQREETRLLLLGAS